MQTDKKSNKQSLLSLIPGFKKESASAENKGRLASIPKTVQESIPYLHVYPNGVIETSHGVFSKSYLLEDVNFKIATRAEQENIFLRYGELLNMFGHEIKMQITIFNRNVDTNTFCHDVLMKPKGDGYDELREEANDILTNKMREGKNNLAHEKYLTVSVEAEGVDAANIVFARLDTEISTAVKKINNIETPPISLVDRLSILYDIYNPNAELPFYTSAMVDGKKTETFSLDNMKRLGLTTKDVIGPSSMKVQKDYIVLEDKYARVLFLDNLPSYLSTDFITEVTDISCNMLTSVHFESLPQDKALRLIRNQMVNINSNVIDAQKRASRSGYSADLISPELQRAQGEAKRIMDDMTSRNQKMFFLSTVVVLFGDTLQEIESLTKSVATVASKYLCSLKKLGYQQEAGFATALPLGINKLYIQRLLTTESASLFIPFSTQELTQKGGLYYGLNAVSRNLILFNRKESRNANGLILGTSGSGKSFAAKREILNVLLGTDDEVYIIDPEREYAPLADLLGGEVVRIAAGSKNYINPFDMDIRYADDDDPVTLKADFIGSLCETIIGGRYGLSPIQKTIIDRCVKRIYKPYLEHLASLGGEVFVDREHTPTMLDFYNILLTQREPEAQNIALALELYSTGSLDTFSHVTNVDITKRFVVYDIKDIGTGMKELGLQVCLNDIWNRTIANAKKGKRTWFYIDEFYLLTQTDSSAVFLQQIFKRARKWGGIPTGITQNVEDLLARKEARGVISNCDFIMMLNQSPIDRIELGNMLGISQTQMSYITNSDVGEGLLYTGKSIVPFIDNYPRDTVSYKVMSTKFEELELSSS